VRCSTQAQHRRIPDSQFAAHINQMADARLSSDPGNAGLMTPCEPRRVRSCEGVESEHRCESPGCTPFRFPRIEAPVGDRHRRQSRRFLLGCASASASGVIHQLNRRNAANFADTPGSCAIGCKALAYDACHRRVTVAGQRSLQTFVNLHVTSRP